MILVAFVFSDIPDRVADGRIILSILPKNERQTGDISVVNAKIFKSDIGPLVAFRAAPEFTLRMPNLLHDRRARILSSIYVARTFPG